MPLPLMDARLVYELHEAALDYAVQVNQRVHEQPENERYRVARGALLVITHDITCLHRATKDLSLKGWAFAAPILLRSMLDGLCSLLAVTQSVSPDLAGFKYFYASAVSTDVDPAFRERTEKETAENVAQHLPMMKPEDQIAAKEFLQRKRPLAYWFQDEFESPIKLLRRFAQEDIVAMYRLFSATSHLGFIGGRLFRDDPNSLDINPRPDFRAMGFAMVGSSRMLAEAMRLRAQREGVSDSGYEVVMALITKCQESAH